MTYFLCGMILLAILVLFGFPVNLGYGLWLAIRFLLAKRRIEECETILEEACGKGEGDEPATPA